MFQPQAIPFSSFAYAALISDNSLPGDYSFQAATSNLGLNLSDVGSFGSQTQRYRSSMDTPPATYDMAAQEALASGYRPDLKGPLVGERSDHDIREEHAQADPVYVAKALHLCQTNNHYQTLLDNANCQWRAINFPYLGTVHKRRSKYHIDEEYGSMSLTSPIETWCDHRKWIFEDIKGEVLSLLTDLTATKHVGPQSDASLLVLRRFNDEEIFSAIICYFRRLAIEFSKANSVTSQDFNPDGLGVGIWKDMLEPLNKEIENPGGAILIDVLMNPMSIAVEIVYRDRSGTPVNSHLVQAEDDNGIPINPAGPIVRLLYRPGHCDILYKYTNACRSLRQQQIIDSASAASNIQINRASVFDRALDASPMTNFNSANLPGTADIPGLSMAALSMSNYGFPLTYNPLSDYEPIFLATTPSILSAPLRPQRTRNLQVEVPPSSLGNQFRHSKYEYESNWNDPSAQIFQTSMFKNSHYNTAHYSNPNFQPEEWGPDDEETAMHRGDLTNNKSTSTRH